MLDGVYRRGTDGAPEFVEVPAPTDEALQAVLHKIITRIMQLLTRRGVLFDVVHEGLEVRALLSLSRRPTLAVAGPWSGVAHLFRYRDLPCTANT